MRIFVLLALFCFRSASAQTVEYVRPLHSAAQILSITQERNLERSLDQLFPTRILHKATIQDRWDLIIAERSSRLSSNTETAKSADKRITYDVLKQHGKKYAVVIFSGTWKSEASQLAIFRIEAGGYPTQVYHSRIWRSNFSDSYHEIQSLPFGKENVVIIKEGENGKSTFVIASLFSFHERKGDENNKKASFRINDLTPHLQRLKALVDFPLKPLYGQAIKLEKMSDHLRLQAGDVELTWDSKSPRAIESWKYDKTSRKFISENDLSMLRVVDGR